jgi:bifunctional non-homologous end joining protein LigD
MRAVTDDLPPDGTGWAYEVKWDGVRAIGAVDGDRLRLRSSNDRDITTRYPELGAIVAALAGHDAVLDGEIVTFNESGRPDFGLLQNRLHLTDRRIIAEWSARQPVVWVLFDLVHLDGHDLFVTPGRPPGSEALPYTDRRRLLHGLIDAGPNWQIPPARLTDGAGLLDAIREQGLEGIVAKRLDSLYEAGRRSRAWRKVKVRPRQELVVGGWRSGVGRRAGHIGSLLVGYHSPNGRLVYAGRVGSGLAAGELLAVEELLSGWTRSSCPFDPPPASQERRDATWVEPRLVVEVAFSEWSRDGRLRHPSYLGRRADKDPTAVIRE